MRILQVCNVGNICGGTAACAWSITHALPFAEHAVLFLSNITSETRSAFRHCEIQQVETVCERTISQLNPDLIILHNTSSERVRLADWRIAIQYQHSVGGRTKTPIHVACSQWLCEKTAGCSEVLYQPIPIPPKPELKASRNLSDRTVVGRFCTPSRQKWPIELLTFYESLARQHPEIDWEFVGAPECFQSQLRDACCGQASFHPSGFQARQHLWSWHGMIYHHPRLTESFGRTCAEAMRAGCVPVVDGRGGFTEQIDDAESGFLCRNLEDFHSAIDQLSDPVRRIEMSKAAVHSAEQNFSLDTFYSQLRSLLCNRELISS